MVVNLQIPVSIPYQVNTGPVLLIPKPIVILLTYKKAAYVGELIVS